MPKITLATLLLILSVNLAYLSKVSAQSLIAFGDSLLDNGNIPRITGQNSPPSPPYYHNRFSNGPTFAEYLPKLLHLDAPIGTHYGTGYNLAVGGAETGTGNYGNSALPGLQTEINLFEKSGRRFGARDLAVVWAGANDYFALAQQAQSGQISLAQLPGLATATVLQATSNLANTATRLASLGARQMVFLNLPDLGKTPQFNQNPIFSSFTSQITDNHNQQLQTQLASIHSRTGANIFLFNTQLAFSQMIANPGKYGFENATQAAISTAAAFAPQSEQNQYLFWDSVHPTTAAHWILARYIANMVQAPSTLGSQTQLTTYGARGFADLISNQFSTYTAFQQPPPSTPGDAKGYNDKKTIASPPLSTVGRDPNFEVFLVTDYRQGQRDDSYNSFGFDYYTGNVGLGAQYHFSPLITAGFMLGYGYNKADLSQGQGDITVNAYQAGGYVLFHGENWYIGGLAAYGYDEYDSKRPGILGDNLEGQPNGNSVELGMKGGYFFHFGNLSIGPVGSLTFTNVNVESYTEHGDPVLTQSVQSREVQDLYGNIGLQLSYNIRFAGMVATPYLFGGFEHEFLGDGVKVKSVFTSSPALEIVTSVPNSSENYGDLGGGVKLQFNRTVALNIGAQGLVGRDNGYEFTVGGGLQVSF
jgi:outer membrane lipase/esterase